MRNTLNSIPTKIRIQSIEGWREATREEISIAIDGWNLCGGCNVADECEQMQECCPAYAMLRDFVRGNPSE